MLFRGDLLHGVLPALRDEIARTGHKYRVTLLAGFAFRACASLQWALQRIDPTHNCTVRCRAPPPTTALRATGQTDRSRLG